MAAEVTRFPLGGPGQRGTWWPARPEELKAFHWCCPACGYNVAAMLSRKVGADGVVETEVGCKHRDFTGFIALEGYVHERHKPEIPRHPDLSRKRQMRHYCGTVIEHDEETANHFLHDPRTARGHWCPTCQRHGWNHEWRWVSNNHVVGDGWLGRRTYEEIAQSDPDFLRELSRYCPVPLRFGPA
jgi:hypothetical protein